MLTSKICQENLGLYLCSTHIYMINNASCINNESSHIQITERRIGNHLSKFGLIQLSHPRVSIQRPCPLVSWPELSDSGHWTWSRSRTREVGWGANGVCKLAAHSGLTPLLFSQELERGQEVAWEVFATGSVVFSLPSSPLALMTSPSLPWKVPLVYIPRVLIFTKNFGWWGAGSEITQVSGGASTVWVVDKREWVISVSGYVLGAMAVNECGLGVRMWMSEKILCICSANEYVTWAISV